MVDKRQKDIAEIHTYADAAIKTALAIDEISSEFRARSKEAYDARDAMAGQWILMASDLLGMDRRDFVTMCNLVAEL